MSATNPAGVPQPADGDELESAVANASDYSKIQCVPDTTYQVSDTLSLPEGVDLVLNGATLQATHGETAVDVSQRFPTKVWGGTIDLGSSGGVGVEVRGSGSVIKWDSTVVGTTIRAQPGTGARGFFVNADSDNTFFVSSVFQTEGVDIPYDLRSPGGVGKNFITSNRAYIVMNDYDIGIRCRGEGDTTIAKSTTFVEANPGSSASAFLDFDVEDGTTFLTEGFVQNIDAHDEFLYIKNTRGNSQANHSHVSFSGHSSRRNPDLVRDETNASGEDDTYVIDAS
jgi:hypothetical protein